MGNIRDIHRVAREEIEKKFVLKPVSLKYPFPERPVRTLGLVKIDGDVFSSERFSRMVFLKFNFPFYLAVRSTFLRPRMEFDLPVFSSEIVITGEKRMLLLDVHRTGESKHDDSALFDRLIKIREKYPDLLKKAAKMGGSEIQSVFSKAVCQVKITEEQDEEAMSLYREYLGVFLEMVDKATPLSGEQLDQAKQAYEGYLKTIVEHDPGVRANKMLFGKEGGVKRALDIFFDR